MSMPDKYTVSCYASYLKSIKSTANIKECRNKALTNMEAFMVQQH